MHWEIEKKEMMECLTTRFQMSLPVIVFNSLGLVAKKERKTMCLSWDQFVGKCEYLAHS